MEFEVLGAARLRLHVHRLRRALGDVDRLAFESGSYRLTVLPGELDAECGGGAVRGSRHPGRRR